MNAHNEAARILHQLADELDQGSDLDLNDRLHHLISDTTRTTDGDTHIGYWAAIHTAIQEAIAQLPGAPHWTRLPNDTSSVPTLRTAAEHATRRTTTSCAR